MVNSSFRHWHAYGRITIKYLVLVGTFIVVLGGGQAHAQGSPIQMMPPTDFGALSTPCTTGGVLYWDTVSPIHCIPGVIGDAFGTLTTVTSVSQRIVVDNVAHNADFCLNGKCTSSLAPILVTSAPDPWALAINNTYYANAIATCPVGYVVIGGGGYCDATTGAGVFLFGQRPSGSTSYTAHCRGIDNVDPLGNGAIAYAYCIQAQ